ncbi:hypothetical protein [Nostocoides vanveenii]|uniref:Uncharacterized protein n=1 Tax=Nostocoides vanveenii TaxID=330835 RepID=A0ABN2KIY8_9MICO
MAPLATILGLLLVVLACTRGLRLAAAIYTLAAALLFATSAVATAAVGAGATMRCCAA